VRLVVDIGTGRIKDPRAIAQLARGHLLFVCWENLAHLRRARAAGDPYPKLYDAGIRYRLEPYRAAYQELATIPTVYERGWGDCKHLVCWRVAEEWDELLPKLPKGASTRGKVPLPLIYWRTDDTGKPYIFHAELRHPDGNREDPSRFLGM